MRDFFNQWLGTQGGPVMQMIGALLVVVVLIVLFAWVMRRLGGGQRKQPVRRGERVTQRLAVVDAAHVDGQRRLVLVRRDEVEHLVMIGGPNDVLIEPRIVRGQPLGSQRTAPHTVAPVVAPVASPPPMPTAVAASAAIQQAVPPRSAPPPGPALTPIAQPPAQQAEAPVAMPPPYIEPVTSPASTSRNNPVAADLRAALSSARREDDFVDTQRSAYATRPVTSPAPMPAAQPFAPAPSRQSYEEPTVAAPRQSYAADATGYASGRGPTSPPRQPAYERPSAAAPAAPSGPAAPAAMSLEDMVAAGLEQAIARPEPAPGRGGGRQSGPAFGQRVEQAPRPVPAGRDRAPAKDAMAAEIERAISGLTAAPTPGGPNPGPNAGFSATGRRPTAEPPRSIAYQPPTRQATRPEPPATARTTPEPTGGRLPPAPPPSFARQPHLAAPVRPTLVANQEPQIAEPVVAVMPQPDALRADLRGDGGRRSSSEIEDEMARLLSELTGTSGR